LKGKSITFVVLMVWRETRDHLKDWYFCVTKHKIEYANIPSALRPVLLDDSMPVSKPLESFTLDSDSESEDNKTG
jgi:hypothetical protein